MFVRLTTNDVDMFTQPGSSWEVATEPIILNTDKIIKISGEKNIVAHLEGGEKISLKESGLRKIMNSQSQCKTINVAYEQCCMCPGAICPGIPGTPHPEDSPCKLWRADK